MYCNLNNDHSMPLLGLGTFLLKSPEVEKIVDSAIKLGYRLIDTASGYKNEVNIGNVLAASNVQRESVFITSKMGPDSQGSEKSKIAALSSLKNLQLDYLDLYLIHWPGASGLASEDPQNKELRKSSWLQLEKLYSEGKFKAIGVSNYTVKHLEELLSYCSIVPAVLQVELHPYLIQSRLRDFCRCNGIHVQAYSSLGSRSGCNDLLSNPVVVDVACTEKKTPAQVLLRWAVQQEIGVIPKSSSVQRIEENMDIFNFSISELDMKRLDDLDRDHHYCWNSALVT